MNSEFPDGLCKEQPGPPASYLTNPPKQGGHFSLSVGVDLNRYIPNAATFFGVEAENRVLASGLVGRLGSLAKFGQKPLASVWLVGHGQHGSSKIGGIDGAVKVADFKLNKKGPFDFPEWDDAVNGRLTPGFWFGESAVVRFIACKSQALATAFAGSVLFSAAEAYGTKEYTYAGDGWMGWTNGKKVLKDVARTPDEYFTHPQWGKAQNGKTEYPF